MSSEEPSTLLPLSDSQREMLEEAVETYQWDVGADALRWLGARGVTPATADTHRLGVVGDRPFPGHEKHRGRLVIPYLDKDGKPVSLRFRCIESGCQHEYHGKYMSLSEEPTRLYNIGAIHRAGNEIHLCEGEFDAIILEQLGLPAVAVAGVNNWMPHHRRMLAGFSRVHLWADPDAAGAEFTNKVTRQLRSTKPVRLREDVSDTYIKHGAEHLLGLFDTEECK